MVRALSAGGYTPFATALAGDAAAAVVWSRRPNDGEDAPSASDGAEGDIAADQGGDDDEAPALAEVSVVSLEDLPPKERAAVESAYRQFMSSVAPPRQAAQEARRGDDKRAARRGRRRQRETLYVRDLLCFVDGDALQHADSLEKVQDAFRDALRWHLGRALSARSCAALGLDEELAQLAGSFLFAGPLTEVLSHAERLQDAGSRYMGDFSDEEEESHGEGDDHDEHDDAAEREELLRMEREDFNDVDVSAEARAAAEAEDDEDEEDEEAVAEALAQAEAMLEAEANKADGRGPDAAAIVAHDQDVAGLQFQLDTRGMSCHRFVHRIVDDFGRQMMQRVDVGAADIHAGAAAHGLQPFQNLNVLGCIGLGRCGTAVEKVGFVFGHDRLMRAFGNAGSRESRCPQLFLRFLNHEKRAKRQDWLVAPT